MKTYEERSPRYRRNAERFESGIGVAIAAVLILAFLALLVSGVIALVRTLL